MCQAVAGNIRPSPSTKNNGPTTGLLCFRAAYERRTLRDGIAVISFRRLYKLDCD
jgi:hypothetical protein